VRGGLTGYRRGFASNVRGASQIAQDGVTIAGAQIPKARTAPVSPPRQTSVKVRPEQVSSVEKKHECDVTKSAKQVASL
jgi:hypothetical protein